ncbi:MAG TPA: hypothetical protein VKU85_01965, partial [bacterium]|nr:hypothetical protein [bacterium]
VRARLRDRVIFAHRISMPPKLEETWAAMSGPWRLLRSEASTALYQVDVDPGERTDVQDRHPDVAGQLEERLAEFRAGGRTREETVDVPMDDAQLEALRSLGYAQ